MKDEEHNALAFVSGSEFCRPQIAGWRIKLHKKGKLKDKINLYTNLQLLCHNQLSPEWSRSTRSAGLTAWSLAQSTAKRPGLAAIRRHSGWLAHWRTSSFALSVEPGRSRPDHLARCKSAKVTVCVPNNLWPAADALSGRQKNARVMARFLLI